MFQHFLGFKINHLLGGETAIRKPVLGLVPYEFIVMGDDIGEGFPGEVEVEELELDA